MMPSRTKLTDYQSSDEALKDLCNGFGGPVCSVMPCHSTPSSELPEPFKRLLVHDGHMTTTLEAFYGRPVELRVAEEELDGELYHRRIVLALSGTEQVVEFGVVRIDLQYLPPEPRSEILDRTRPLGEILIRHNVMRRIDPRWYLRFPAHCGILSCFGPARRGDAYGRVGTIYCNEQPAIELLEVVADVRSPKEYSPNPVEGGRNRVDEQ